MTDAQQDEAVLRRVGRPSVAPERREQIFDAVERCLVEVGMAGTTLDAIAERACMTRSAIAHFVGNRDAVVDAAVARSVDRFMALATEAVVDVEPEDRLDRFIDFVLAADRKKADVMAVLNEVVAYAHHDEHARRELRRVYVELEGFVGEMVADRCPAAGKDDRAAVTNGLILLLREFDRVRTLGATSSARKLQRQVRGLCHLLIASLEG